MPQPDTAGLDLGDIPSWIAIALSLGSLAWQYWSVRQRRQAEALRIKLERIDKIAALAESARTLALSYWLVEESLSCKDGLLLNACFKDLSRAVHSYSDLLWPEATQDVLRFKIQATGANFQQRDRQAYNATHSFVQMFMHSSSAFSARLSECRDQLHTY